MSRLLPHASPRAPSSSPPAARARSTPTPPIPPWPPATASPSPRQPAPSSPTWSSTSSIPPRSPSTARRASSSPKRCAARARTCATIAASASWSATIRCSNSPRATWWPAPSPAKAWPNPGQRRAGRSSAALRPVYLDMRHVRDIDLAARFPGISAFLAHYGLDLSRDLIPVRPAAHYLMGGIRTDLGGRTIARRALRRRRGRLHRRPRRQSPGLELSARRPRLRRARRALHARRRAAARRHAAPDPGRAPMQLSPPEEAARGESHRRVASLHVGQRRPAARGVFAATRAWPRRLHCEAALAEIAATGRASRRLAEAQA